VEECFEVRKVIAAYEALYLEGRSGRRGWRSVIRPSQTGT
jgi:hypothetical protein